MVPKTIVICGCSDYLQETARRIAEHEYNRILAATLALVETGASLKRLGTACATASTAVVDFRDSADHFYVTSAQEILVGRIADHLLSEALQEIAYKESKKKPHHQFTSKSPWERRKKR